MRWRIYYDDGTTYSDEDGSLIDAPAFGVQAIVCEPDVWHCGDIVGLIDYLVRKGIVKFGRLTSNEAYQDAVRAAQHDSDFDTTTRHIYERGDYYWFEGE